MDEWIRFLFLIQILTKINSNLNNPRDMLFLSYAVLNTSHHSLKKETFDSLIKINIIHNSKYLFFYARLFSDKEIIKFIEKTKKNIFELYG